MVEAAPQAQPKTTWNAQKDFVQLRVLLGTFLHVFIISARFPFPMSEKVSVLASFFEVCFWAPPWGAFVVPPVVPKGVVLRHFFSLLGYLFGYPILAPFFDSF